MAILPPAAAEALHLRAGSSGGVLERLRYLDDKVALYVQDFVLARCASARCLSRLKTARSTTAWSSEPG